MCSGDSKIGKKIAAQLAIKNRAKTEQDRMAAQTQLRSQPAPKRGSDVTGLQIKG